MMNFVSSLTEMSISSRFDLVQLQLRSASESIQPVLIIWFELGSAHEKSGVWTGPYTINSISTISK